VIYFLGRKPDNIKTYCNSILQHFSLKLNSSTTICLPIIIISLIDSWKARVILNDEKFILELFGLLFIKCPREVID